MEIVVALLVGLVASVIAALAWRWWSDRREPPSFEGRTSLAVLPGRPDRSSPEAVATEELVARMRNRPLAELGIGRALPRTARTIGICPRCGRTLERGRRRCAGCGAWLVDGIPARRAGAFLVRGAAIGVLVGLFGGLLLASLAPPGDSPEVAAATNAPDETMRPAPSGVRTALDALLAVDARLVAARDGLAAALADPASDASSIAGQLRAVDAESAEAVALTQALDRWERSADLAADVRSFHIAVREAATPGIRGDAAAARAAGTAVMEALAALGTMNARTVELAREVGLLPPAAPAAPPPSPSARATGS